MYPTDSKAALLAETQSIDRGDARPQVFDYIEAFYSRERLQSRHSDTMKHVNTKICMKAGMYIAAFLAASSVNAANVEQQNLVIEKVRAVGNFEGTVADNTVELWFSTPLSWPAGSACTDTRRVYIDASNQHLIAAAYLALTAGKKVAINTDDNLPVRAAGACEISYIDVQR